MMLPYTIEVFFAAMAEYNRAWFPLPLVALVSGLAVFALAVRPLPGRPGASARFVGAVLAAAWLWVGWAHQLQHMAGLNFMAPVYGWAWILQGGLIALTCTIFGRVRFGFGGDLRGWTGLALALFGLLGYPLVVLSLGHGWDTLPVAGMAPDPTAIFTAGLLAAARDGAPLHLFVLPVAWAGVAAVSGYLLGFLPDYAVAAAILAAAALAVWRHTRRATEFGP